MELKSLCLLCVAICFTYHIVHSWFSVFWDAYIVHLLQFVSWMLFGFLIGRLLNSPWC
uniref:Uncharacterized protein n=1 Tax=Rhizophora mucronata TaxID=61149 RepID=A0A2P2MIF6_RHIMU